MSEGCEVLDGVAGEGGAGPVAGEEDDSTA